MKNSMIRINKTASNIHFNEAETDRELIFQQLYYDFKKLNLRREFAIMLKSEISQIYSAIELSRQTSRENEKSFNTE
ncbi:hypothetical protein LBHA_00200 [Leptospira borgpetersenii serovar Hardjo]|nr:hypothetical protein LBHA_00200 [Leptospira borgpetersenii serovar Hardjo]